MAPARSSTRGAAGNRPISVVLGELVSRAVDRYRSSVAGRPARPDELVDALGDARRLQADLAVIVERLERLSRTT